ncbi:hypothetical protein HID58_010697 [Brassica napus]|uniref:Uncharacterized protein n=1 Tax=Brassica napus TaxID=3708 RepID=A0ABQ8DYL7_BRANA|nr:hypothetical protein HID58_010697 [Brassica napus]
MEVVPELPSTLSNASMDCQGTPVTMFTSISSSSHVQNKNQAVSPNSLNILPILVDSHSTPTITPAMEFSPSNIIYNEVQGSLVVDLLITSPQFDKKWERNKTFYQISRHGVEDGSRERKTWLTWS